MSARGAERDSNPFSTRHVRPGTMAYLFREGQSGASVIARLAECGWRGQILGPHGTGKSTLLATLLPLLSAAGKKPLLVEVHDGQRRLPVRWGELDDLESDAVIVVDGYEQLGRLARWRLDVVCRRQGCGLLVTAHDDAGLPEIFRTDLDLEMAQRVVDELLPPSRAGISSEDVERSFREHAGDLREALFALYDLYERRRAIR